MSHAIISCFSPAGSVAHNIVVLSIRKYDTEIAVISGLITMADEVLNKEHGAKYIGRKLHPGGALGEWSSTVEGTAVTVWKMEEKVVPGFVYNGAMLAPTYAGVFMAVPVDSAMTEINANITALIESVVEHEATNDKLRAKVKYLESERRFLILEASQNKLLMENYTTRISEGEAKHRELEAEFERWQQIVANKNETISELTEEINGQNIIINNCELAIDTSIKQMQLINDEYQRVKESYEAEIEDLKARCLKLESARPNKKMRKSGKKFKNTECFEYSSDTQPTEKTTVTQVDLSKQDKSKPTREQMEADIKQTKSNFGPCITDLANFDHSKLKSRAQRDELNAKPQAQERLRPVFLVGDMIKYSN